MCRNGKSNVGKFIFITTSNNSLIFSSLGCSRTAETRAITYSLILIYCIKIQFSLICTLRKEQNLYVPWIGACIFINFVNYSSRVSPIFHIWLEGHRKLLKCFAIILLFNTDNFYSLKKHSLHNIIDIEQINSYLQRRILSGKVRCRFIMNMVITTRNEGIRIAISVEIPQMAYLFRAISCKSSKNGSPFAFQFVSHILTPTCAWAARWSWPRWATIHLAMSKMKMSNELLFNLIAKRGVRSKIQWFKVDLEQISWAILCSKGLRYSNLELQIDAKCSEAIVLRKPWNLGQPLWLKLY